MTLRIHVTEDHIIHGERGKCAACPIALALRPLLKRGLVPKVSRNTISIFDMTEALLAHVPLPPLARTFVQLFDMPGGRVNLIPFAFDIALPDELLSEDVALVADIEPREPRAFVSMELVS